MLLLAGERINQNQTEHSANYHLAMYMFISIIANKVPFVNTKFFIEKKGTLFMTISVED
jgi:hypothetical protein